jgi:carboxymethylenebutenolidase
MPTHQPPVTEVSIAAPGGTLPGYLAAPTGDGPWPGVVVIHDAFGLSDNFREHADRLARAGYLTVAPDFYGYGPKVRCVLATMRSMGTGTGVVFDHIEAARRWLADRDDCTGRVGVVGFCMGGGFAILAAARSGFHAAAPNYGRVPAAAEQALSGSCPVVGSYGERDRSLRGHPERLDRALTSLGVEHDVKTYPKAGHSFMEPHQPLGPLNTVMDRFGFGYDAASAEDAWSRILAFFAEHLSD